MKYLSIILLLFTLNSFGQNNKFTNDCNTSPVTIVGSIDCSVKQGYVLNNVKLGIWQNNKPSGFTILLGYGDVISKNTNKLDKQYTSGLSACAELGWKIRVNDWFLLHGYAGTNNVGQYLGSSALFQVNRVVLVGANYKQQTFGLISFFAF
jgi:hypothetical protein